MTFILMPIKRNTNRSVNDKFLNRHYTDMKTIYYMIEYEMENKRIFEKNKNQ